MERTLTFSVLGWWHLNIVGRSASHQRAVTSKKKRWISIGNKLGWLLIDSPSYIRGLNFILCAFRLFLCLLTILPGIVNLNETI